MGSPSIAVERRVPLLDLQAQHKNIREETIAEVIRVIDSQHFILGDDVKQLEASIAEYCSTPFAIGCASGSDALFLALLAAGVGPGDRVLTTPYTFFATVGAICRAGATPVFADIEPDTFNIDPARVAEAFHADPEIRAVIPVHLFGACANMDPICKIAASAGATVIEDAAQSLGSEYNGRRAGSIGHIGCFSFFPSKNLGAYGDGGILTTTDPELAAKLSALRIHGTKRKYYHDWIGINSRLDALQAAVLRVKLRYLDEWTAGRQRNAQLYREHLAALNVPVTAPGVKAHSTRHIYNQFVICGERRDELQRFLKDRGIGSEVYYPLPMHIQACFAHLGYRAGDFPISERLANTSLALPVYPELPAEDIAYVCAAVKEFYG
jgi:dTDP-4-amino-4,6-dideoxygalactose transaminase